jgi:serine/threonine protein kinase/tetratricopeptide (TPR) repeat protein
VDESQLFANVLKLSTPAERAAYLDEVCAGNPRRRADLEALLRAHARDPDFLERPAGSGPDTTDQPAAGGPPGERAPQPGGAELAGLVLAGRYKLLEQIGEGGMGTVWMARQTEPVKRVVAVKLIKPGMDSAQVLGRFEAERQALALMDHPNIAKVLDAGATESGRPYFVMELVKGVPITKYCDERRLTPRQRLELFAPVCHAIQHAHQKGVIHRDLKPSNVLVALYDDRPVPKVIDFGVAKATGAQLTEETLHTGFGAVVGTVEYMSPEQAGFNQLDVDTRSDIYSLGVLLYELLAGSPPFTRKELKTAGVLEMLRVIREQEPSRPSTKLSTAEGLPTLAANRGTEPAKLTRLVRGELDWIVMKALEKDRGRRFESASAFAADIARYLKDEPVSAGPPGTGYRLRKFARRNRRPVVAAVLVLLALVLGVIGTTIGLLRAEKRLVQLEKANEILGSIFKDLNPDRAEKEGKPLQALLGERLDQATAQLEGEVIGDSLAVARMQMTLGESQLGLAYPEKAIRLLAKARATFTAQLGPDHPDTLQSMHDLADAYRYAGNYDLALRLFEETLERRKTRLGADHPDTLQSMHDLALGYRDATNFDLALPLFEETVRRRKARLGADDPDTLNSMNKLADAYRAAGKLDLALPLLEETLVRRKAKLGVDHLDTLESMNDLALCYWSLGRLDLALPLSEETLALLKAKLGPDHPHTLREMNNLALVYIDAGKLDLAVPLLEDTVKRIKAKSGPDHPETFLYTNNLARAYLRAGQAARAEPVLRECLVGRDKKEPDAWRTFEAKSMLGAALLGQRKFSEAEPLLLAGYQGMKEREGNIPKQYRIRLTEAIERLVQLYVTTGDRAKNEAWQKKLVEAKAITTHTAR